MSNIIPYHGAPTGSVFGIIGDLIGTDEGKPYIKYEYDSLNIGWDSPRSIPPVPTVTPTPSTTPYPVDTFFCEELYATGSSKCDNIVRLEWTSDGGDTIFYNIGWGRAATLNDPVLITGNINGVSSSLMNGVITFEGFVSSSFAGEYWLAFSRQSQILDTVKMKISIVAGANPIRSARLIGYTSGSNTSLVLSARKIQGSYIYHTRNLSGILNNGTKGFISELLTDTNQTISVTGSSVQSMELIEILGYNDPLSFIPREIKECLVTTPTPTPAPSNTPSHTPTQTPTTTGTPTPTLTQTVTTSPTITYTGVNPLTPTPSPTITSTPTPTPTLSSTPTPTPTPTLSSTPTPTPTKIASISVWIDYDADGRAQASWLTPGGEPFGVDLSGEKFTTAVAGEAILINSLKISYGTNIRYAEVGSPDPRGASRQIDATTDLYGFYNFDYLDPYGIQRNANGASTPYTLVYAVACGRNIVAAHKGTAATSSRYC